MIIDRGRNSLQGAIVGSKPECISTNALYMARVSTRAARVLNVRTACDHLAECNSEATEMAIERIYQYVLANQCVT